MKMVFALIFFKIEFFFCQPKDIYLLLVVRWSNLTKIKKKGGGAAQHKTDCRFENYNKNNKTFLALYHFENEENFNGLLKVVCRGR